MFLQLILAEIDVFLYLMLEKSKLYKALPYEAEGLLDTKKRAVLQNLNVHNVLYSTVLLFIWN